MRIDQILNTSNLKCFSSQEIKALEDRMISKTDKKGNPTHKVRCLVRQQEIALKPEEAIRQLFINWLVQGYGYSIERIRVEYPVNFGRSANNRADVVVLDETMQSVYIVVELKSPQFQEGIAQLKSYAHATGAPLLAWCNGNDLMVWQRKDPNTFTELWHLPRADQSIQDVSSESFTYMDLQKQDILQSDRVSLKDKILLIEDDVLANSGENAFEEVFKLIFTKLYDELQAYRYDKDKIKRYHELEAQGASKEQLLKLYENMRPLEFALRNETNESLSKRLQELFTQAKDHEKWQGIFPEESRIALTPDHLAICVGSLQKCKFFNSNLEVIDDAFEYLANKDSKGEKGQFFTPRYVIDMCVRMLNPKPHESMIDPASGSCGFPIHTCFYVWRQIYKAEGLPENEMLTAEEKHAKAIDYVKDHVFAIDFDPRTTRISKMLNLIAGDGHSNVFKLNSLDFSKWHAQKEIDPSTKTFNKNFDNLVKKLPQQERKKDDHKRSYKEFAFDIVMANPPFAGNIKENEILKHYTLRQSVHLEKTKEPTEGLRVLPENADYMQMLDNPTHLVPTKEGYKKIRIKEQPTVTRDVLFIERNLNLLKPGGRMAIVLPQGRFNNASDQHIREFIAHHGRILAVVGLHPNVFKPHTGTKTSVLFVQKWDELLCPYQEDYNIFFATMQEPSKDNSGDKIYVKQEIVKLERTTAGQPSIEELNLEDFYTTYPNLEAANFIEFEGRKISAQEYKKLNPTQQKQATIQTATKQTRPLLDKHGHLIVKHDLFNHEGLTQDGIAEAFIEFAKSEGLSFWQ
ncbi:N-6 DNA methylase [Helicobacter ailurogastricus]|nr:N-6 DNA methylase [Helicobacter ailurogastricus]GLH58500.1 restriction endonuclease subunit M [Helicobacter ailurogastricus]GLH60076.1 restriction endonuclease subunit M [Helicobacter ailurogastricus]